MAPGYNRRMATKQEHSLSLLGKIFLQFTLVDFLLTKAEGEMGGRIAQQVMFLLRTQRPQVQFLALPNLFLEQKLSMLLRFIDGAAA